MGINRNIVECKEKSYSSFKLSGSPVLIETLWNVKQNTIVILLGLLYCINRNIVECKEDFTLRFADSSLMY